MAVVPRPLAHNAWLAISVLALTATAGVSTSTVSPTLSDSIAVLGCRDVIGSEASPPSESSIILGAVALPTGRALQANPDSDPHATLFAKDGLFIRRGAAFDLIVPDSWRGRLAVSSGTSPNRQVTCGFLVVVRRNECHHRADGTQAMTGLCIRVATSYRTRPVFRSWSGQDRWSKPSESAWAPLVQVKARHLRPASC